MPIVAYNDLPSLQRITQEGYDVLSLARAEHQDIRELHIGFLNMMPDAAFLATERQFFRLVSASTSIVQIYIHPIRCEGITRNAEITAHIDAYYEAFDDIKAQGLDAIIVTGANPKLADLTQEAYWQHATEIFAWAEQHVVSVFFSCLATHALLQAQYGIYRAPLPEKIWGVFSHRVADSTHPLVSNINTRFDMPHSRWNDVSQTAFTQTGLKILVSGEQSGVALATSSDGFRQVFCQGHPEYDTASLLKEYKREIARYIASERTDYPQLPVGYLSDEVADILMRFQRKIVSGQCDLSAFPEKLLLPLIDNTWRDTAKAIFSNWIGLIYRVTHVDRQQWFMDGIDPDNPLSKWY